MSELDRAMILLMFLWAGVAFFGLWIAARAQRRARHWYREYTSSENARLNLIAAASERARRAARIGNAKRKADREAREAAFIENLRAYTALREVI